MHSAGENYFDLARPLTHYSDSAGHFYALMFLICFTFHPEKLTSFVVSMKMQLLIKASTRLSGSVLTQLR